MNASMPPSIRSFEDHWKHFSENYCKETSNNAEMTLDSLRHPRNAIKIYQQLYLISRIIGIPCARIFGHAQAFQIIICSVLLYFTCGSKGPALERVLTSTCFLLMLALTTFLLYTCGVLYSSSAELLQDWKEFYIRRGRPTDLNEILWEAERRQLQALQPIKFSA